MPAADARLRNDPESFAASMHTRKSGLSCLSAAARLMGATGSLDATHASRIRASQASDRRAISADVNKRNQPCADKLSPTSPNNSGCRTLSSSAHNATNGMVMPHSPFIDNVYSPAAPTAGIVKYRSVF